MKLKKDKTDITEGLLNFFKEIRDIKNLFSSSKKKLFESIEKEEFIRLFYFDSDKLNKYKDILLNLMDEKWEECVNSLDQFIIPNTINDKMLLEEIFLPIRNMVYVMYNNNLDKEKCTLIGKYYNLLQKLYNLQWGQLNSFIYDQISGSTYFWEGLFLLLICTDRGNTTKGCNIIQNIIKNNDRHYFLCSLSLKKSIIYSITGYILIILNGIDLNNLRYIIKQNGMGKVNTAIKSILSGVSLEGKEDTIKKYLMLLSYEQLNKFIHNLKTNNSYEYKEVLKKSILNVIVSLLYSHKSNYTLLLIKYFDFLQDIISDEDKETISEQIKSNKEGVWIIVDKLIEEVEQNNNEELLRNILYFINYFKEILFSTKKYRDKMRDILRELIRKHGEHFDNSYPIWGIINYVYKKEKKHIGLSFADVKDKIGNITKKNSWDVLNSFMENINKLLDKKERIFVLNELINFYKEQRKEELLKFIGKLFDSIKKDIPPEEIKETIDTMAKIIIQEGFEKPILTNILVKMIKFFNEESKRKYKNETLFNNLESVKEAKDVSELYDLLK